MNRGGRQTRNNQTNKPFVSGGVISNFMGAQQQAAAPQLAPAQPVPKPVQQPKTVPAPVPAPAPLTSTNNILINIQETPQAQPNNIDIVVKMEDKPDDTASNGSLKRRFTRQPIPKKIKRLRRNRRLRKILTPKNALMSLHELLGAGLSDFNIVPDEAGFVATVFVNNVQYEGRGQSKMAAKNSASEKALRDIIIQKMIQSPRSTPAKPNAEAQPAGQDDLFHEDVDMNDGNDNENENDEEGEVPMLHLASFALHKLFSEWQSEGFEIPDFKTMVAPGVAPIESMTVDKPAKQPGVPPKRTQVPENAESMHPTTLLCMMRPSVKYVDLGSEGQVPNIQHRVGVEVDENHFIGSARNKKLARKLAALEACNKLFGTNFVKDETN